jgi:hypothetical protein
MSDLLCPVCNKTMWRITRRQNEDGVITHLECQQKYLSKRTVTTTSKDVSAGEKSSVISPNIYNSDYETSRDIASVFSFIGWVVLLAGIGVTVSFFNLPGGSFSTLFVAALPGFYVSVSGMAMILWGAIAKAIFDNADNNKRILLEIQCKSEQGDEPSPT